MVTKIRSINKNDTDIQQMPITDESSSPQKEEEDGFYSSCGQAFIRIR